MHIRAFSRIRPGTGSAGCSCDGKVLRMHIPDPGCDIHSKRRSGITHEFKFDGVFLEDATQSDIFNDAARQIVESTLNGFNGTIFAYGQTASGKTYTIEGKADRFDNRGLAPRALSLIYETLSQRKNADIEVYISYMEIYQEIGYDLLNASMTKTNLLSAPFSKVVVIEGAGGIVQVRGLSKHLAANQAVAESLLLQGQANRKVAETAANQRSSRSHAIFTLYLTSRTKGSDIIHKSKLHLVDLAGSERVSKTGVAGIHLSEARSINLSLHHLEQVIIALQQETKAKKKRIPRRHTISSRPERFTRSAGARNFDNSISPYSIPQTIGNYGRPITAGDVGRGTRRYIPYRNSLLTMLLKDSLGGNCMTAMIATISLDIENIYESLSTCRFAQRVQCISNLVKRNEVLDERTMIRQLNVKITDLERQLKELSEMEKITDNLNPHLGEECLTTVDRQLCSTIVDLFISFRIEDPVAEGIDNFCKFRECCRVFRERIVQNCDFDSRPTTSSGIVSSCTRTAWSSPPTRGVRFSVDKVIEEEEEPVRDNDVPRRRPATSDDPPRVKDNREAGNLSSGSSLVGCKERMSSSSNVVKQSQDYSLPDHSRQMQQQIFHLVERKYTLEQTRNRASGRLDVVNQQIDEHWTALQQMDLDGTGETEMDHEKKMHRQLKLKQEAIKRKISLLDNQIGKMNSEIVSAKENFVEFEANRLSSNYPNQSSRNSSKLPPEGSKELGEERHVSQPQPRTQQDFEEILQQFLHGVDIEHINYNTYNYNEFAREKPVQTDDKFADSHQHPPLLSSSSPVMQASVKIRRDADDVFTAEDTCKTPTAHQRKQHSDHEQRFDKQPTQMTRPQSNSQLREKSNQQLFAEAKQSSHYAKPNRAKSSSVAGSDKKRLNKSPYLQPQNTRTYNRSLRRSVDEWISILSGPSSHEMKTLKKKTETDISEQRKHSKENNEEWRGIYNHDLAKTSHNEARLQNQFQENRKRQSEKAGQLVRSASSGTLLVPSPSHQTECKSSVLAADLIEDERTPVKITATPHDQQANEYINMANAHRVRVDRIRRAQEAAKKIQKMWRSYRQRCQFESL